ncbi:hypothetical protein HEMA109418_07780 [Helcobacillus massiliensis]|uniref:Uncharacterized protein n=1 Tax=Helcobacillus massiliensis TaxID=521392 RepID=A0A839R2M5_9MICO|nr:hypothetical protein [Helcobacillus massiliensis]
MEQALSVIFLILSGLVGVGTAGFAYVVVSRLFNRG